MRNFLAHIFVDFLIVSLAYAQPVPSPESFTQVEEEDGSPICYGYSIKFGNDAVTDNGDGTCSVAGVSHLTDLSDVSSSTATAGNILLADGNTFGSVSLNTAVATYAQEAVEDHVGTLFNNSAHGTGVTTVYTDDPGTAQLILYCNGTDGSTTITDSSTGGADSPHTMLPNGDFQIDTAQSQFGGASCLMDGTTDYVGAVDSADWTLSTNDFMLSFFVRFSAVPASGEIQTFYFQGATSSDRIRYFVQNNGGTHRIIFDVNDGGATTVDVTKNLASNFVVDTWYYVSLRKVSDNYRIFVGTSGTATQIGTTVNDSSSLPNIADGISIGNDDLTADREITGWIDDFVLTTVVSDSGSDGDVSIPTSQFTESASAGTLAITVNQALGDHSDVGTATPTSGFLLVGDGDSWEGVDASGDVDVASSGAVTIQDNAVQQDDIDFIKSATATGGNLLVADGNTFGSVALSGDATLDGAGVLSIAANSVALGTDTTGNYVESITTSALTGLTGGLAAAEGTDHTLAWDYSTLIASNPALDAGVCVPSLGGGFVCEGNVADTNEGLIRVLTLTADRAWTFPDASGTIIMSGHTFTGDVTATLGASGTTALTIANNAVATAEINFISSSTATAGNLIVADGNTFGSIALTGDCTLDGLGVISCTNDTQNTLDEAYDEGGAGSGRTIIVDSGAVELTATDAGNNVAFVVNQDDTGTSDAVQITNDGTGNSLTVTNLNDGGVGNVIEYYHNSASPTTDIFLRESYFAEDSAGNKTEFARNEITAVSVTDGVEIGRQNAYALDGASLKLYQSFVGGSAADIDGVYMGDVTASKYLKVIGTDYLDADSNTVLAGSIDFISGGTMLVSTGESAFCLATDIDACMFFNSTGYELTDLGGTVMFQSRPSTRNTSVLAGNSGTLVPVGGTLFQSTTTGSNSSTTETDLYSTTIPATTLQANGDALEFYYAGQINTSANNKQLRVKYGATTCFDSTAQNPLVSTDFVIHGKVVRTGAATQKCTAEMSTTGGNLYTFTGYATPAETLTGTVVLKLTGQGGASNEIDFEVGRVSWSSAPN